MDKAEEIGSEGASPQVPEERYAYYRRCQRFLRSGKQCKAPAMKGESICHQHAMQAEARRRHERQREEILARPGTGFRSRSEIGRTALAMVVALYDGRIEEKTAQQLVWAMQKASPVVEAAEREMRGRRMLEALLEERLAGAKPIRQTVDE